MDKEKIIHYVLNNIADVSEKETIAKQIIADKLSKDFYISIKNANALTKQGADNVDLNTEYKKLSSKISPSKYRFLKTIMRYAAVIIITISITIPLLNHLNFDQESEKVAMNEVICPAGQIAEVVLSDGTHVWLNAESSLNYQSGYNNESRNVELSGEAFFDVTTNKEKPFFVNVKGIQVKVVGTSFNINAYGENDFVEATLVEGKIEMLNNAGTKMVELSPGQLAKYDLIKKRIFLSEVDTRFYSSWKEGRITFFNEDLQSITTKLERWYNVKFTFSDDEIKRFRFSGTILKHKPLYQVLEIIKHSSPIKFKIIQKREDKNEIILSKLNQ